MENFQKEGLCKEDGFFDGVFSMCLNINDRTMQLSLFPIIIMCGNTEKELKTYLQSKK